MAVVDNQLINTKEAGATDDHILFRPSACK